MSDSADRVRIVEVGPRDGLQNEKTIIPAATKIELINRLSATGLRSIEATSFVSPKWVPQLADAAEVFAAIDKNPRVSYPVLVPNLQGYQRAREVGAAEVAVFTAASEAFSRKNINASIDESIERFKPVLDQAKADGVRVRGRGDAANLQVGGQRALHAPLGKRTRSRCCQEARAAQQGPKGERAAASGLASREILAAGAGHGVWLKLMERQVANGLRRTCSFEHCCAGPVSCVSDSNDPFGST